MERTKTKITKLISIIFSPPLMAILLWLAFFIKFSPNLTILFVITLILTLPACIYLFYILIIAKSSDIDISSSQHRFKLLVLIFISFLSATIILHLSIPILGLIFTKLTFLFALLALITYFWKISMYAFFYTLATLIYASLISPLFLWFLTLLPIIWWSRYFLKKHTIKQLLFGSLIAFVVLI